MPFSIMETEYLTRKQVAEKLQITTKTVDNYCRRGLIRKLKADKGTRAVRFDADDLKKVFKHLKN